MPGKLSLRISLVLICALILSSVSCQPVNQSNNQNSTGASSSPSWDALVSEFLESYFVSHPDFAVRAGRHEFDGKLPDWSSEALASVNQRLRTMKDRARAFADTALDERQRFERDYLVSVVDGELF